MREQICAIFMLGTFLFAGTAYSADSLYAIPMSWKDDTDKIVSLQDFEGKSVVLTMVYTSCKASCPLIMNRLKTIEKAVKDSKKETEFVVVSMDPEVDTPATLAKFRTRHKADEHWHFLVGSDSDTRKLSLLIGLSFQKNQLSREIAHSNEIVVLDKKGVISITSEWLSSDIAQIVGGIAE